MSEVSRIQEQLQRAMEGGAWHGPALLELLRQVPVDLAPAKPLMRAHSIWEIVLHVTAWNTAGFERIQGRAVELSPAQDWPAVSDFSESAWQAAINELKQSYQNLYQAAGELPEARLSDPVPGRKHDIYFTLHGVIQHIVYHAGQIALLKKSER